MARLPQPTDDAAQTPPSRTRRAFLRRAAALGVTLALRPGGRTWAAWAGPADPANDRLRAAVIGHTGRGNYGHDHDLIFNHRPEIEVVAVADPDPAGRAKAAGRCRAKRQYADYREMLAAERPRLVAVTPRWTDQHHAMGLAALRGGAHLYFEKPITQTLAEADELLRVAEAAGLQIAVAHQMRLAPAISALRQAVADGLLGELLELRAHGKQDARAGGEDLIVLGTHMFDLMRLFGGDAHWCAARVTQQGRDITPRDAHPATENIGPIVGDEVQAQFAFSGGVNGVFTSRGRNQAAAGHWGLELVGTKASARILADIVPRVLLAATGEWGPAGHDVRWQPWPAGGALEPAGAEGGVLRANQRVADDWLAAIAARRAPACSGSHAMKALEMAHAVFHAGLTATRVPLPLANRAHPLASNL